MVSYLEPQVLCLSSSPYISVRSFLCVNVSHSPIRQLPARTWLELDHTHRTFHISPQTTWQDKTVDRSGERGARSWSQTMVGSHDRYPEALSVFDLVTLKCAHLERVPPAARSEKVPALLSALVTILPPSSMSLWLVISSYCSFTPIESSLSSQGSLVSEPP